MLNEETNKKFKVNKGNSNRTVNKDNSNIRIRVIRTILL